MIDDEALGASLRRLTERGAEEPLRQALQDVTEACVDLFGVAGSGLMLADEQSAVSYVAATDGPGRAIEQLETELGEGPCTTSYVDAVLVASDDLDLDPRWPQFCARRPEGVQSLMGAPLRLGAVTVGTIDVYRGQPYRWTQPEQAALRRYCQVIETTMMAAVAAHRAGELANQLQYALEYRSVIERGVGYLMGRDGLDAVIAFNRLRRAARNQQRRIGDVAQELLSTGRLPGERR